MSTLRCFEIFILFAFFLLFPHSDARSEVSVTPIGMGFYTDGDTLQSEITISNFSEEAVDYRFRLIRPDREERELRGGPRRDEPGDVLQEIEVEQPGILGIGRDFENDVMWVTHTLIGDAGVPVGGMFIGYRLNGDEVEVVDEVNTQGADYPLGGTYYAGVLYATVWQNSYVIRYDLDGENLGNINMEAGEYVMSCAVDPERALLFVVVYPTINIIVFDINNDFERIGVIQNIVDMANVDTRVRMFWSPYHEEGNLWFSLQPPGEPFFCWQVEIDDEWNWEEIQHFEVDTDTRSFGVAHDGTDLWIGRLSEATIAITDDGIIEPNWLLLDPYRGQIEAESELAVTITIAPGVLEDGVWESLVQLQTNDPDTPLLEMTVLMSLNSDAFSLSGIVTDAATNEAVEGVSVSLDQYLFTRFTDEEGVYSFENLPPGEYELTFTEADYLPTVENVTIDDDDEELNVGLLHARFVSEVEDFDVSLEPDLERTVDWQVSNTGNGLLTYSVERRLVGGADVDPWTVRLEVNAQDSTGDSQLNGVVAVNGLIYVSGGNNGDNINLIHIFDPDGNFMGNFEQFQESRYGMRDLTYDGELIWGADETTLYGFTTDGELVQTINGQARAYRALCWDPDREVFWSADVTTDIFATNLDGNQVGMIDVPIETRIYGLSYWADDPDGYCLYIFTRGNVDSIECQVNKLNVETGEQLVVAPFADVAGRPGGMDISSQFDIMSWVILGLVQSPDRVVVWQLEGRRDWFLIEPEAGQIAAGESEDFHLHLSAVGIPAENQLAGELVFVHDGVGSQTIIPVLLRVVEGEVQTTRDLDLQVGWNLVSVNLQPDSTNVEYLTAGLVEAGLLEIMKDGAGNFYLPAFNHNNIPGWSVEQGYMMKMRGEATLTLAGMSVLRDRPIDLAEGWSLVAYYPNFPVEATMALGNIADHLIICKDGYGNFYVPDWDYSNMGNMQLGQGYYMKTDADITLVYVTEIGGDEAAAFPQVVRHRSVYANPGRLPVHPITDGNMSLLVTAAKGLQGEVAVFAGDRMVGTGVLQDGSCGLAVWGDDSSTEIVDGAVDGEALQIRLLVDGTWHSITDKTTDGELVYTKDAMSLVEMSTDEILPLEFALTSVYPNPFNSKLTVGYTLPEPAWIDLNVYDISGRLVVELVKGEVAAGLHTAVLDGSILASGVYIVRFKAAGHTSQVKVTLLK